jgi:hypothetical protein
MISKGRSNTILAVKPFFNCDGENFRYLPTMMEGIFRPRLRVDMGNVYA